MPRPDPLLAQLQREIADLRAQVKTLQSAPRLRHASIDDASVPVKGADGRVKAVLGKQADGSHGDKVIESGPQPTPTPPILDAGAGALSVEWDGRVVDGSVPVIFGRVEVLAAPVPEGITPASVDSRHLSSIYSAEGGATTIKATSGEWMIWLRMVGADGKTYSEPSEPMVATIGDTVDELTLRERIESALTGELEDGLYDSLAGRIAAFIELEAESIKAYHLAFDALDGQLITGATFQTHHAPDRGIKWTDDGAVGYDEDGRVTLWLDGERNRISGTFRMEGGGEAGDIVIRDFRAEELFTNITAPENIYTGIGFEDVRGDAQSAGIFISPYKTLTMTTGAARPDAWMSGGWRVQRIRPRDSLEPDVGCRIGSTPIPLNLINGWRLPTAVGDPHYVRFGKMVILKGGVRTPASGDMGPIVANLPAPSHLRRLTAMTSNLSGTQIIPWGLDITTSGNLVLASGSSQTQDRTLHLDGLSYFVD